MPVNKDFIIRVKTINCVDNGHHGCEKELTIKIKGDKSGQQTIVLTPDTITVDDSPFAGTSKTLVSWRSKCNMNNKTHSCTKFIQWSYSGI